MEREEPLPPSSWCVLRVSKENRLDVVKKKLDGTFLCLAL